MSIRSLGWLIVPFIVYIPLASSLNADVDGLPLIESSPLMVIVKFDDLVRDNQMDVLEFALGYSNIASTVLEYSDLAREIRAAHINCLGVMPACCTINEAEAHLEKARAKQKQMKKETIRKLQKDPFIVALLNMVPKKTYYEHQNIWSNKIPKEEYDWALLAKIKNTIANAILNVHIAHLPPAEIEKELRSFKGFYAEIPVETILKDAGKDVALYLVGQINLSDEILRRSEKAREIKARNTINWAEFLESCPKDSAQSMSEACDQYLKTLKSESIENYWQELDDPIVERLKDILYERKILNDKFSTGVRKSFVEQKKEQEISLRDLILYPLLGLDLGSKRLLL